MVNTLVAFILYALILIPFIRLDEFLLGFILFGGLPAVGFLISFPGGYAGSLTVNYLLLFIVAGGLIIAYYVRKKTLEFNLMIKRRNTLGF